MNLFDMFLDSGSGRVDDVHQQLRRHGFFQGRLEGFHQLVRQMAYETRGVRQDRGAVGRQFDAPQARVQRREQLIRGVILRARKQVEQRSLAGVRVSDEGNRRQVRPPARAAAEFAPAVDPREALANGLDALPDHALVEFELLFAGAAQADTAFLPVQMGPAAFQTRAQMPQLGEFDLQLAFVRTGPLGEYVQDQSIPVKHPAAQPPFEIALLARRQRMIEQHQSGIVGLPDFRQFRQLAGAQKSRGFRPVT